MEPLRWTVVAVLAWCCAAGSSAQTVSLPLSQAIECMTPPEADRGVPDYPAQELQRKDGGTVRVELVFATPDRAPEVRVLTPDTFDGLIVAVRAFVERLRVPCIDRGAEPVRIVQEYVFRPDDGRPVFALAPVDQADAERARQSKCLMRITPEQRPEYPRSARESGAQGSFLVRLRFADPGAPPEADIVAGPRHRGLRRAVEEFLPGFRLPCQRGEPKTVLVTFHFRLEGGPRAQLRDMSLQQFLGLADSPPPARFDFNQMACPFDLRVTHYQPYATHTVAQIGDSRPERGEFARWLSRIKLRLTENQTLDLLGTHFTLSVPCGRLDL
jgi:hypothetical protein